jgi:hypothetical protein
MTGMVLAACSAVLLHASAPARFCGCAGPRTDAEAVRASAVVFEGRPLRSRLVRHADRSGSRVFTFAVTRTRKGAPGRTVEVETASGTTACGMEFPAGRTYTVYAHRGSGGGLTTSVCPGPYLPIPQPPARGRR